MNDYDARQCKGRLQLKFSKVRFYVHDS